MGRCCIFAITTPAPRIIGQPFKKFSSLQLPSISVAACRVCRQNRWFRHLARARLRHLIGRHRREAFCTAVKHLTPTSFSRLSLLFSKSAPVSSREAFSRTNRKTQCNGKRTKRASGCSMVVRAKGGRSGPPARQQRRVRRSARRIGCLSTQPRSGPRPTVPAERGHARRVGAPFGPMPRDGYRWSDGLGQG